MQQPTLPFNVPAGVFISPVCAPNLIPAATAASAEFLDHYAVMGLDRWATSEEIKIAHRKLRAEYFRTDARKYAALQAAYAVLVNWEARRDYDAVYRLRLGLPAAPPPPTSPSPSTDSPAPSLASPTFHPASTPAPHIPTSPLHKSQVTHAVHKIEVREAQKQPIEKKRVQDPNWTLKHYQPTCRPVLGTRPYPSFVPILEAYEGREMQGKVKSRRPRYVGKIAGFATPE